MIILDEQLSPHLAKWIQEHTGIDTYSASYLNLTNSLDKEIFEYGKQNNSIIITKDSDFIPLLSDFGPPPKIIYITCGNTSNKYLRAVFEKTLIKALKVLNHEDLVELSD
jgi:predicted nuclease of predicted toxin-antitoxin system